MKRKIIASLQGELFYVGFKLPAAVVAHVDKVAHKQLRSRSDVLRSIIVDNLRAQGVVATGDEVEAP